MLLKVLFLLTLSTYLIKCDPVKGLEITTNNWKKIEYDWPNIDNVDLALNRSTEFYYFNEFKSKLTWKFDQSFKNTLSDKQTVKLSFKYWASKSPDNPFWHNPLITFNEVSYGWYKNYEDSYKNIKGNFWMPFEISLSKEQLNNFEFNIISASETSISAIKDLRVQYENEITTKGEYDEINFEYKEADTKKLPKFHFPTSCYLNDTTFHQDCVKEYNFNLTAATFTSKLNINQCINIKVFTLVAAEIIVKMNGHNDKTQNEIFNFKPLIVLDEQNYQSKTFCLYDYTTLTFGNVILTFNVIFKQPLKNTNYFGIYLINEAAAPRTPNPKYYFLSQMKNDIDSEHKWTDEWHINSHFEANKDRIDFSGSTYNEEESTEVLLSKWIEFNPERFKTDARIRINVSEPKIFDSFRIKPQICDEIFHCIDTYVTKFDEDLERKERIIDFNFDTSIDAQKIKLKILVEYFKPSYLIDTIFTSNKFSLSLLNFGDPCFENKHKCIKGTCSSNNTQDGKARCSCVNGYFGDKCEDIDYCTSLNKIKEQPISGITFCAEKNCINMNQYNQRFRCSCDDPMIPNWNSDSFECEKMKISKPRGWQLKDTKDPTILNLFPNAQDNNFEMKFSGIDERFCLKISYSSKVNSILQVKYKTIEEKEDPPFQYFLKSNPTGTSVSVCITDFRFTIEKSFSLIFKLSKITSNKYPKDIFNITNIEKDVDTTDITPINWIEKWEKKDLHINEDFLGKNFIDISDTNFKKEDMRFKLEASITEFTLTRLMSKWIIPNPEFSKNPDNYFTITLKDKSMDYTAIEGKILYHVDKKNVTSNLKSIAQSSSDPNTRIYKFEQIPENIGYFRIIIEFMVSPAESKPNIEFSINKFSFGDPCFTKFGTEQSCHGINIDTSKPCSIISPMKKKCNCKEDDKYAGEQCEYEDICKKTSEPKKICDEFTIGADAKCISKSEKEYDCPCSMKYFIWDFAKKRCLRTKEYKTNQKVCDGKTCIFMSDILKNSNWANKNLPQIDRKSSKKNIPFFYTNEKINTISFENKNKVYNEFCLTLKTKSQGNSSLSVYYDGNSAIILPKLSDQKICVSDLEEPVPKNLKINLRQNHVGDADISLVELVQSDITANNIDLKILNPLPYLVHWDYLQDLEQYKPENQWSLRIPIEDWELNPNELIFTAHSPGKQQSYIFSHWIEPSKEAIMFRSKFTKNNILLNFTLTFLIADNKLNMQTINSTYNLELDIKDKSSGFLQTVIPKQTTNFKFVIRIDYDLDKSKSALKLFTLENIDIGDPCIRDGYTLYDCNKKGLCIRDPKENYGYKCKCNDPDSSGKLFTGKDCEIEDYCNVPDPKNDNKKGNEICPGSCQNIEKIGYKCNCSDVSTYWDFDTNKCKSIPKCLSNPPDCKLEKFEKCSEDKGNVSCICIDGYVKNGKNCELYNPCNTVHRSDDDQLCSNVENSFCQPLSFGLNAEWDCLCNFGYQKSGPPKGSTICLSVICKYPSLNKCQQICEAQPTNDTKADQYKCSCYENYNLDKNKHNCNFNESVKVNCDKKCETLGKYCDTGSGQCKCKQGFEQNGNDCLQSIDKLFCPTGNLSKEINGKEFCDCGNDYQFNSTTLNCDLKPICGEGGRGRKECDPLDKLCILDPTEDKLFKCVCKFGLKEQQGNCVNYCDTIDKDESETRSNICKQRNAKCNQNLFNLSPEQVKKEEFCECASGFVKNKDLNCVISEISSQISLPFKEDFSFCETTGSSIQPVINSKLHGNAFKKFILDSISMNQLNQKLVEQNFQNWRLQCLRDKIGQIILDYIDNCKSFHINNCRKEQKSDYITCTFTAIFLNEKQRDNSKFFNKLKSSCYPYDKENCFIEAKSKTPINYNTLPVTNPSVIIKINNHALQTSSLPPNKGCDGDPCLGYSNCVPAKNPNISLYSCRCNQRDFLIKSNESLLTDTGRNKEYSIEQCKGKNICPKICLDEGNKCIQEPHQDNNRNWTMVYACTCNQQKYRNNATSCTNICDKVDCNKNNADSKIVDGTCQCVCKEGYYGSGCDSEHSVSKGGWIAGIVVLAVLVVILAGVAFMFARRSRNNSSEYSGRPMDDYSGSSYRVPPNQSRGQQNPSFTRD